MSSKNNLSNFCCDPKNDSLHNYAVCYRTGSTVDHDLYDWRSSHILQPFFPLAKYPLYSGATRPQITLLCSEVTRPQITLLCSGSACPHITWMLSVGNRGKEIWTPEQPPILASLYVSSRIQTLNFLKALARQ